MKKIIVLCLLTISGFTYSQVLPNYVPSNGILGWWPFNGNANDESGNGNNGIVNGATLTKDRFENPNKAYKFDGINDLIDLGSSAGLNSITQNFSISYWIKDSSISDNSMVIACFAAGSSGAGWRYHSAIRGDSVDSRFMRADNVTWATNITPSNSIQLNSWTNIILTRSNSSLNTYKNGNLISQTVVANVPVNATSTMASTKIGVNWPSVPNSEFFLGKIDDIGIWNRALDSSEIVSLYNSNICYQYITVTDTLLINIGASGFNPISYNNTIKIFPNPTNDHITIDYGNYMSLNGYQLKITNSVGQQMFQTLINQQSSYIDLNGWTGNGLYFVHIVDASGNTVDIKKIVLQ